MDDLQCPCGFRRRDWLWKWNLDSESVHLVLAIQAVELHIGAACCLISSSLSDGQVLFPRKQAQLSLFWLLWSRETNPLWRYLLVFAVRAVTLFPFLSLGLFFWSLASQKNRPHVSLVIYCIWTAPPPPSKAATHGSFILVFILASRRMDERTLLGPKHKNSLQNIYLRGQDRPEPLSFLFFFFLSCFLYEKRKKAKCCHFAF